MSSDFIERLHDDPIEDFYSDLETPEDSICDNPEPIPTEKALAAAKNAWNHIKANCSYLVNDDGTRKQVIKATKSDFVRALIHLDGANFDFTGRQYLRPIYDRDDPEILLKTARQVEKCVVVGSRVLLSNGKEAEVQSLTRGDLVVGMDKGKQSISAVVSSEDNGDKPCLVIRTRLGSELRITNNHPLRTLCQWREAESLLVGDKIASLRKQGEFGSLNQPLALLIGLMVGDGSYTKNSQRFTAKTPEVHDLMEESYGLCHYSVDDRSGTRNYFISKKSPIYRFIEEKGMVGQTSSTKSLPDEVFDYDEESTRSLLIGLWATDGHCKNVSPSKVDLVFASASEKLCRQVRLLLRKFGIVTTIRNYKPKNVSYHRSFIIRVVTRRSVEEFFRRIGPIPGKSFSLPVTRSSSNLDTLPKEIHDVILRERKRKGTYWKRDGLQSKGLRINREYCPTFEKVSSINEHLKSQSLEKVLSADIIWDEIVEIEDIGICPTWALQTENETFISDFIVNHNTTFLANNLVVDSVVLNYNKSLYVSPSHTQTRQFSSEKLKPAIERSPLIKTYFQDSSVSMQVFEKGFTNGAFVFLRSAFRSADRARGVSARNLALDEIQDMLIDQIPVIRECTSHFLDARTLMAGTPKSLNNPIEVIWKTTTQNEWLVPCPHCKKWNFLDEKNIAPTELYIEDRLPPGPVCKYCAKPIDPTKGQWVSFNKGAAIVGYRVPQLMVPWICGLKSQWLKLLWKRDNYPISQFYNEVLGISYDSALSPVTQEQLMHICGDYDLWDLDNLTSDQIRFARGNHLTGGIDWGEGLDGSEKLPSGKTRSASYSVLTIGYYHTRDQYKVIAIKKFVGKETDPDYVVSYCAKVIKTLGIQLVGVDWGHGWMANNALVRILGPKHVVQFQYLPKLKEKMKYDPIGYRYHLQRNFVMSEFFYDLKKAYVCFPRWSHFQPFAKDILAIYAEYNEFRREIKYDHRPSEPDDFYHSCLFAKLASDIMFGRTRRYTSRRDPDEY